MDEGTPKGACGDRAEGVGVGAGADEGDYELDLPLPTGGAADGVAAAEPSSEAAPPAPAAAADEPPKPLHDPDPYSTPPYGHPGPWAPAPPVQHPATTQAQAPTPAPVQPAAAPSGMEPPAPVAATDPALPPAALPASAAATPDPASPSAPGGPAVPGVPEGPGATDNPWHRYDPWAPVPAGPLQQTGVGVLSEGERRRQVRKRIVGGALALALASGVLGGVVGAQLERKGGFGGVKLPQASAEPTGRAADSVAGIAARALPSVVTLHVSGSEESGTGTGFVLDTRGHILTNNHVVEPAGGDGEITVVFSGGQSAKADVVGRDSGYDLAVVKVRGVSGLRPLPLGNSDGVQVGDPVVAIGAPFDLEGTVTSGIISAKERPITAGGDSGDASDVSYVDALQTDAPINPGNSGGPLLDARGRVIGINSAIRSAADGSDSGSGEAGSIGLGFAIPVNQGRRVAEELINTGHATHPVIGVTLDLDYAGDGARVSTKGGDAGAPVTPGGPGALAGIQAGDVITEVDGTRVHSGTELIVKTRAHRPGDRLELTVERDGRERTLSLVLGSAEGD
ncbi:S1C family serine protease [Streptomyces griseoruber]|uniref:S1C family serine protease n=2 Tax=Streptomyces griseoruber TaxID=1943 RepID=UPI000D14CDC9|nr:trypsin-like peptidase domain-containing protein [Streptomyces griseoruber]